MSYIWSQGGMVEVDGVAWRLPASPEAEAVTPETSQRGMVEVEGTAWRLPAVLEAEAGTQRPIGGDGQVRACPVPIHPLLIIIHSCLPSKLIQISRA